MSKRTCAGKPNSESLSSKSTPCHDGIDRGTLGPRRHVEDLVVDLSGPEYHRILYALTEKFNFDPDDLWGVWASGDCSNARGGRGNLNREFEAGGLVPADLGDRGEVVEVGRPEHPPAAGDRLR